MNRALAIRRLVFRHGPPIASSGACPPPMAWWQSDDSKPREWGRAVEQKNLSGLRFLSFSFLLPGLAGLILSACISTHYMNTLPRFPDPQSQRMIPRNINGYISYQTEREDRTLNVIEYSSVLILLIGLGSGLVYLQKWGIARALEAEDDEFAAEES